MLDKISRKLRLRMRQKQRCYGNQIAKLTGVHAVFFQMEEEVRLWAQRGQRQLQKGRTLKVLSPQSKDELEKESPHQHNTRGSLYFSLGSG